MPADKPHPADSQSDDDISWVFDDNHTLDLIIADKSWAKFIDDDLHKDVKQLVLFVSGLLENSGFSASMRWTNDAEMKALNRQFREKDKATNVLSFPNDFHNQIEGRDDSLYLGDLAFGYETMAKEASDMGITVAAHMRHLIIHGLLHLIGCDHEDEEDATEMEGLEIAALSVIGVENPYQGALL